MGKTRPDSYWNNWNNVYEEMKKIMQEYQLNSVPSPKELKNLGHSNLLYGVYVHHRRFRYFKKRFEAYEGHKIKSTPELTIESKKFEDIAELCKRVISNERLNDLPSQNIMTKLGYGNLAYVIKRYHGGFPVFREKLRDYLGKPTENKQLESMLEDYVGGGSND